MTETPGLELTREQLEFAERMGCGTAALGVDRSVCLYRVVEHETIRWIVDADGSLLDWTVFHAGG